MEKKEQTSQMPLFQIAGGSIVGRRHLGSKNLLIGKNNQDALNCVKSSDCIIAVVSDGCGSSSQSEIGSQMVCEWVCKLIPEYLNSGYEINEMWPNLKNDIIANIKTIAQNMSGNFIDNIMEKFLFTILGCIITPENVFIFSVGDGVYFINDKIYNLGPFPHNAPPFIAYDCIPSTLFMNGPIENLDFNIQIYDTDSVESILIGTDGVLDLIKASDKKVPGKDETIGDISQFWTSDIYFKNSDALRRRLAVINREYQGQKEVAGHNILIDEHGPLGDDTTMVVLRKVSS